MNSQGSPSPGKVLLTGGSGFIASHVLDQLLDHGVTVVVTVRSAEKGQRIIDSYQGDLQKKVSFVVVEDVTKEGAFDAAVKSDPPFDYVIHTASPYFLNPQDPVKDFLDPAIKGTTGILHSLKAHAPSVKRVVFTSSSAAILNPKQHPEVYDETYWAPMTWEEALQPENAYKASKIFAEKAAWNFISTENPPFDLATINNTYTLGPVARHLPDLPDLSAVNASNHRIRDLVCGKLRNSLPPTAPVFTFVDVRDVALAHVRAMMLPEAGGQRFYVVGGYFSNKRIVDIVREGFPWLEDCLPSREVEDDFPGEVYGFDNGRSRRVLGLEYRGLRESVVDTVRSMLGSESESLDEKAYEMLFGE